jgi:hypothetical protein
MCVFSVAKSMQVTCLPNNYYNQMYLCLFPLKNAQLMVSNRHVYQLVGIVTSVLNCGLCSLWAAIKENMLPLIEGRDQGGEGLIILKRKY